MTGPEQQRRPPSTTASGCAGVELVGTAVAGGGGCQIFITMAADIKNSDQQIMKSDSMFFPVPMATSRYYKINVGENEGARNRKIFDL